jgi:hypothetical protein
MSDIIHWDKKIDALVNLYRASCCIALSDKENGLSFVKKALPYLDDMERNHIKGLMESSLEDRILAEKILDVYLRLKTF